MRAFLKLKLVGNIDSLNDSRDVNFSYLSASLTMEI